MAAEQTPSIVLVLGNLNDTQARVLEIALSERTERSDPWLDNQRPPFVGAGQYVRRIGRIVT
jgi:hypothetical protein